MVCRLFAIGAFALGLPALALAGERPVVVELFTSQGCSSCPPADIYLGELARTRSDVLPLAFHVTYWNYLGWRDPFSLEAATQRQSVYGRRFGDGSYTPEMVVDGRKGLVGSARAEAEAAIEAAKRTGTTAAPISVMRKDGALLIQVGAGKGSGRVVLFGFDKQHRTAIGRGENSGRSLIESNIVRSVQTVGQWAGSPLKLTAASPEGEEIAVILEDAEGRIIGAARGGEAS